MAELLRDVYNGFVIRRMFFGGKNRKKRRSERVFL
jgi:hypothetical protein